MVRHCFSDIKFGRKSKQDQVALQRQASKYNAAKNMRDSLASQFYPETLSAFTSYRQIKFDRAYNSSAAEAPPTQPYLHCYYEQTNVFQNSQDFYSTTKKVKKEDRKHVQKWPNILEEKPKFPIPSFNTNDHNCSTHSSSLACTDTNSESNLLSCLSDKKIPNYDYSYATDYLTNNHVEFNRARLFPDTY